MNNTDDLSGLEPDLAHEIKQWIGSHKDGLRRLDYFGQDANSSDFLCRISQGSLHGEGISRLAGAAFQLAVLDFDGKQYSLVWAALDR